jgi:hypothetical protein
MGNELERSKGTLSFFGYENEQDFPPYRLASYLSRSDTSLGERESHPTSSRLGSLSPNRRLWLRSEGGGVTILESVILGKTIR